jgi:hypothetical protein
MNYFPIDQMISRLSAGDNIGKNELINLLNDVKSEFANAAEINYRLQKKVEELTYVPPTPVITEVVVDGETQPATIVADPIPIVDDSATVELNPAPVIADIGVEPGVTSSDPNVVSDVPVSDLPPPAA